MGRNLRIVVLSVVVAASMVLCMSSVLDSDTKDTMRGSSAYSELTIGFMEPIGTLNPFVALNTSSLFYAGAVYDTLTCIGNDLELVPNLAVSLAPVPLVDPEMLGMPFGSIWQYNLSHNVLWSDGVPFTADDVVFNVWLHANVTNYESMWAYQPYAYFMKEAWKVDDYTVRISFWDRATGDPIPASFASNIPIHMLPKHMLENYTLSQLAFSWKGIFSELESPGMPIVTTGPFIGTPNITAELQTGDHITLVRNPNCHWSTDYGKDVHFDRLVLRMFDDSVAMVLALQESDIDVAAYHPTAFRAIQSYIESGNLENVTTFNGPKMNPCFTELEFCMNDGGPNPSRLDPVIREALHNATNKQYIVDNLYLGYAEPGSTLLSPSTGYWHYEPNASEMIRYDLLAAASSLEANGYEDVDNDTIRECTSSCPAVQLGYVAEGTELEYQILVRNTHSEEKDIAQYLRAQWSSIGVNLLPVIVDEMTMMNIVYSYSYDIALLDWSGDMDPNHILFTQSRMSWNGWSQNRYYSEGYDENYTASLWALDPVARKIHVDNCQRTFYQDNAYIITTYQNQTYAWRTDTFVGWDDWSAHPGRSLDNIWTGNPLFFDLMPIDITPPETVASADPNPADMGSTVTLNGSLSTDNWEIADYNWTFTYEGEPQELHGQVVQFVFSTPGTYNITLNCTDPAGNYDTVTIELVVNPWIPEFGYLPAMVIIMAALFVVVRRLRGREL